MKMNKIYSFLLLLLCAVEGHFAAAQTGEESHTMTYCYEFKQGVKVFQGRPVSASVTVGSKTYTCKQYTDVLDGKVWALSLDKGVAMIEDASDKLRIGMSASAPKFLALESSDFQDYMVKSVTVRTAQSNNPQYELSVYAGGVRYYCGGQSSVSIKSDSEGVEEYRFELKEGDSYNKGNISISFLNGGASTGPLWIQSIAVEYVSSKIPANLSFGGQSAFSWFVDGAENFKAPALQNPYDLDVTYSSNNEEVATVDENTGAVTLTGVSGRAVISAQSNENGTYASGKASYQIVAKKENVGHAYRKVSAQDEIMNKGIYVLACESAGYAMSAFSTNNMKAVNVYIEDDMYIGKVNASGAPYEIFLEEYEKGGPYWLKTKLSETSTGYISSVSGSTNIVVGSKNAAYSRWNVNVDNSVSPLNNCAETSRYLAYTWFSSNSYFKAFTAGNSSPTALYRLTGTAQIKSKEGYATFYTDRAFIMPEGLEGAVVTTATSSSEQGGELTLDWRYPAGSIVPANTGLLLKGETGKTYVYVVVNDNVSSPAENLLHGSMEEELTKVGEDTGENYKYYELSYSADGRNLGFYWGEESGAPFMNGAGKAYLALENGSVSSANGFSLSEMNVTGIGSVLVEHESSSKKGVYSLSGMKLGDDVHQLPSGLYIVNGKKVYVR